MASSPGPSAQPRPRVLFWGTYDLSKPRTRILIAGLRENGVQVDEHHTRVWEDIRDKGVLTLGDIAIRLWRVARAYPALVVRFLRADRPDVVIVGYLGQLDVLVLRPFALLRRVPLVWDQFISLHDTVVHDRQKVSPQHPFAKLLYAWEWLACRAADCVLMDTHTHAEHVAKTFHLPRGLVRAVWVGAESSFFVPLKPDRTEGSRSSPNAPLRVLFFGQLIPLHGIDTIVQAARLLEHHLVQFLLIGSGQEETRLLELLKRHPLANVEWKPWVEYSELTETIQRADVCLGIFGLTDKASRVIPNKVFQVLAARRPLLTRDSSAIRELLSPTTQGVRLVPAGNAQALADALLDLAREREHPALLPKDRYEEISPVAIGRQLLGVLYEMRNRARPLRR